MFRRLSLIETPTFIPRLSPARRAPVVAALGSSLTVSWVSSYAIPAVPAVPMAKDLGMSPVGVFGAFSMALVVSAMRGPWSGSRIDRIGWRGVLLATWDWREACLGWAWIHFAVAPPLNGWLPKGTKTVAVSSIPVKDGPPPSRLALWLLAFVFAVTLFDCTAMAAHLPELPHSAEASTNVAIVAGALVGPAQVAPRSAAQAVNNRSIVVEKHRCWI